MMKTTIEFLDEAKARLEVSRDTELAIALGLSKAQISQLRSGTNCFGDETARRVATLLDVDPAFVIACAYAERANSPEIKGVWVRMAQAFATLALGVGLGASVTPSSTENSQSDQEFNNNIHYTKLRRRWSDALAA
jgi:transcriptional regulator with XRE-family HTH domain